MTTLQEMLQRTTSTAEHNAMMRSVAPFCDYFNVNHIYYAKISSSHCSVLGTCTELHEFLFDDLPMFASSPQLRKPDFLKTEVNLLKNTADATYQKFLDISWNKFNTHFSINIQQKSSEGIESCGFGLKHNHPQADEDLLNELPLIYKFIDYFRDKNKKLINIAQENQVEIASLLGPYFNEEPIIRLRSEKRDLLLKQMGLEAALLLTPRELEILKFVAYGYPASYIAENLHLSTRTVENYIAVIKSKLDCESKVNLIKKAHEITSISYPRAV